MPTKIKEPGMENTLQTFPVGRLPPHRQELIKETKQHPGCQQHRQSKTEKKRKKRKSVIKYIRNKEQQRRAKKERGKGAMFTPRRVLAAPPDASLEHYKLPHLSCQPHHPNDKGETRPKCETAIARVKHDYCRGDSLKCTGSESCLEIKSLKFCLLADEFRDLKR